MHTLALQLAPILGAEKSKVPFYIAGGALVAWALFVAMALGMRKPDFPGGLSGQRAVSAITAVLVIAVASTAVITSGGPKPAAASTAAPSSSSTAAEAPSAPASSTPASTAAPASTAPASTTPASTTPAAPAPASTSLALSANPEGRLTYSTKALSAKAGNVTIKLANASPVEHNVTIALGSTVLGAAPTFAGGSKTIALKLKPGKYSFYCSVPGHRQAGMEGTLTVS
jgi:plastocyanin